MTINSAYDYKLVFEDVSGAYSTSDKALDDVVISDGACEPYSTCDFESSYCGWYHVRKLNFAIELAAIVK